MVNEFEFSTGKKSTKTFANGKRKTSTISIVRTATNKEGINRPFTEKLAKKAIETVIKKGMKPQNITKASITVTPTLKTGEMGSYIHIPYGDIGSVDLSNFLDDYLASRVREKATFKDIYKLNLSISWTVKN